VLSRCRPLGTHWAGKRAPAASAALAIRARDAHRVLSERRRTVWLKMVVRPRSLCHAPTLPSPHRRLVTELWPWPCRGCGGPVTKRAIGRTPHHCSDNCRSAAWRDQAAGRTGPDLARLQAARRAARAQEPRRLTPGEQGIIRYTWLAALVAYEAYNPGLREAMQELSLEVAVDAWPEPIVCAAASGLWPGDEGAEGVIEAVVSERMKLARLAALRGATRRTTRRGGLWT